MRGSSAGIGDGLRCLGRRERNLLTLADYALAALVVSPLTVSYWRGTWGLLDALLLPDIPVASAAISLVAGLAAILVFTLAQDYLTGSSRPGTLSHYVSSRCYTAAFALACVASWRGAWQLVDLLAGTTSPGVAALLVVSLALLTVTKTLRNASAPPFAVTPDRPQGYYTVPTMFKTSRASSPMYLLDCLFSVCVIGTLVVFVWRGCWTLLDNHLFPNNPPYSSLASTVIGYVVVLISFSSQDLVKGMVRKLSGLPRLILVDLYLLFSFCGTINVWRGIWSSLNIYLLPNDLVLSCLICHVVSFLMLVLLNSSNSVLVRGVYIDAEEEGDTCIDFPCYYLRLILQDKIKKKLTQKKASLVEEGLKEGLMDVNKKIQIVSSNGSTTTTEQTKPSSPETNTLLSTTE